MWTWKATNNYVETEADTILMTIARKKELMMRNPGLHASLQLAEVIKNSFGSIHFHHIYHEHNQVADRLSKQACNRDLESL